MLEPRILISQCFLPILSTECLESLLVYERLFPFQREKGNTIQRTWEHIFGRLRQERHKFEAGWRLCNKIISEDKENSLRCPRTPKFLFQPWKIIYCVMICDHPQPHFLSSVPRLQTFILWKIKFSWKALNPNYLPVRDEAQFCSLQIFYSEIDLVMPILISTIIHVKHSIDKVFWTHS